MSALGSSKDTSFRRNNHDALTSTGGAAQLIGMHQQVRTAHNTATKVDRIRIDKEKFPLELFEAHLESNSSSRQRGGGRISFRKDDYDLKLFESMPEYDEEQQAGKAMIDSIKNMDPEEQNAALEAQIYWCVGQAKREGDTASVLVDQAQDVLEQWHETAEQDSTFPVPSFWVHDRIIRAWRRIGLERPDSHAAERAEHALQLLLNLLDQDKVQVLGSLDLLFTWVIRMRLRVVENQASAATSLLDSATRTSRLLLEFERRSDALSNDTLCKQPKSSLYSVILNTFNRAAVVATTGGQPGRHDRGTDSNDTSTFVDTAARRSNELLTRIEERAERFGGTCSPPDAYAYRSVLSAWACVQSLDRAQNVLHRMENAPHLRDMPLFHRILLHSYSLVSPLEEYDPDNSNLVANKALSLLATMDPGLTPKLRNAGRACELLTEEGSGGLGNTHTDEDQCFDGVCYSATIQVLVEVGALGQEAKLLETTPALLAEVVLDRMEELHQQGKLDRSPSLHCYANVLRSNCSWARYSQNKQSVAGRIESILQRLEVRLQNAEFVPSSVADVITENYREAVAIVGQVEFGGSASRADAILMRLQKRFF